MRIELTQIGQKQRDKGEEDGLPTIPDDIAAMDLKATWVDIASHCEVDGIPGTYSREGYQSLTSNHAGKVDQLTACLVLPFQP